MKRQLDYIKQFYDVSNLTNNCKEDTFGEENQTVDELRRPSTYGRLRKVSTSSDKDALSKSTCEDEHDKTGRESYLKNNDCDIILPQERKIFDKTRISYLFKQDFIPFQVTKNQTLMRFNSNAKPKNVFKDKYTSSHLPGENSIRIHNKLDITSNAKNVMTNTLNDKTAKISRFPEFNNNIKNDDITSNAKNVMTNILNDKTAKISSFPEFNNNIKNDDITSNAKNVFTNTLNDKIVEISSFPELNNNANDDITSNAKNVGLLTNTLNDKTAKISRFPELKNYIKNDDITSNAKKTITGTLSDKTAKIRRFPELINNTNDHKKELSTESDSSQRGSLYKNEIYGDHKQSNRDQDTSVGLHETPMKPSPCYQTESNKSVHGNKMEADPVKYVKKYKSVFKSTEHKNNSSKSLNSKITKVNSVTSKPKTKGNPKYKDVHPKNTTWFTSVQDFTRYRPNKRKSAKESWKKKYPLLYYEDIYLIYNNASVPPNSLASDDGSVTSVSNTSLENTTIDQNSLEETQCDQTKQDSQKLEIYDIQETDENVVDVLIKSGDSKTKEESSIHTTINSTLDEHAMNVFESPQLQNQTAIKDTTLSPNITRRNLKNSDILPRKIHYKHYQMPTISSENKIVKWSCARGFSSSSNVSLRCYENKYIVGQGLYVYLSNTNVHSARNVRARHRFIQKPTKAVQLTNFFRFQ